MKQYTVISYSNWTGKAAIRKVNAKSAVRAMYVAELFDHTGKEDREPMAWVYGEQDHSQQITSGDIEYTVVDGAGQLVVYENYFFPTEYAFKKCDT